MADWQPIETAPRDGDTSFVAWGEDYGFPIVFWDPTDGKPLVCADGHQFAAEEWCWAQLDGSTLHKDCFTHWMPLPEPPATPLSGES